MMEVNQNKKLIIPIGGMHCANCANTIEKALSKVKGILKASVNYASEKATVEYDDKQTSEFQIKDAINKTGYKALK